MDPQNEPWTPKPYQPKADEPQPAAPSNTPNTQSDPYAWQHALNPNAAPAPQPQHAEHPELPPVPPAPQTHSQPASQPQSTWAPPAAPPQRPPAVHNGDQLNMTQQYGGKMAELPPLAAPETLSKPAKKQRLVLWAIVAALVILPAIGIGVYFLTSLSSDSNKQATNQQLEKVSYNKDAIAALAKQPLTQEAVDKLDKESTFYTVFKAAAVQPTVQTKWDVYYTDKEDSKRGDQYTLYDTTIDYKSKKYSYAENTYSNLGVYQTRCIGDKQYNYNDSKLTTSPAWQPAGDSTDCKLNTVTMHTSDGVNAGGLSSSQADTFIRKIKGYNIVKVTGLSVATNQDKQYIKVDAEVIPQKQSDNIRWGMQLLMNAFQATGVDSEKHPYTFFGAGREGAKISYYIDAATQLPAYAVMHGTAPLNADGKPELVQSYSHRYIEYAYPEAVVEQNLTDNKLINFTAWPDH